MLCRVDESQLGFSIDSLSRIVAGGQALGGKVYLDFKFAGVGVVQVTQQAELCKCGLELLQVPLTLVGPVPVGKVALVLQCSQLGELRHCFGTCRPNGWLEKIILSGG